MSKLKITAEIKAIKKFGLDMWYAAVRDGGTVLFDTTMMSEEGARRWLTRKLKGMALKREARGERL